jgi:hypothetical protein
MLIWGLFEKSPQPPKSPGGRLIRYAIKAQKKSRYADLEKGFINKWAGARHPPCNKKLLSETKISCCLQHFIHRR